MLQRFFGQIEKKRAQRFLESVQAWYQTCSDISRICHDALNNEDIINSDIGTALDKADRNLFALRTYISDVRGLVRRQNPALASRVSKVSGSVFKLRNQTAHFLIRCQGPGPFQFNQPADEQVRKVYYYRALEDVGFTARQMQTDLDQEIDSIWHEMQHSIAQAKQKITR